MELLIVTNESEESQEQRKHVQAITRRFPEVVVRECSVDDEEASQLGVIRAPGVVIDGVVLSLGSVVSAGKLRRFIERIRKRS